jgi:hypothetical protein
VMLVAHNNKTLESSLSKLAVEDVSDLYDMLIESDNEELERSFRKVISPGHVQTNREFYETLKGKSPPAAAVQEEEDGSDQSEDDSGISEHYADDPKTLSPRSPDERTPVIIQNRHVLNELENSSDYESSQEEIGTAVVVLINDRGQHVDSSSFDSDEDDGEITEDEDGSDSDDDHDDDDDDSSGVVDDDDGSDEDVDDDDGSDEDDDDDYDSTSVEDVDETVSDNTEESSCRTEQKLSVSWHASVADEENGLHHSTRSKGLHESSGKSSFRRQMDLMNSERLNSFHSLESKESSTKSTRNTLREDLEAQIKERVQTNDESIKRELERSFHRTNYSDQAMDGEYKYSDVENRGDDNNHNDDFISPLNDEPPIKPERLKKTTGNVLSSMSCIYLLFAIVFLLAVGVIVLAIFFVQAD